METVTGYLIDPEARTVTSVQVRKDDRGGLDDIYAHTQCDEFTIAHINDRDDVVFVDDEGLLKHPEYFFALQVDGEFVTQKLAGRGLVLGGDAEGNSTTPSVSLDFVKRSVRFYAVVFNLLVQQEPS